jgi:hypothetical protein
VVLKVKFIPEIINVNLTQKRWLTEENLVQSNRIKHLRPDGTVAPTV